MALLPIMFDATEIKTLSPGADDSTPRTTQQEFASNTALLVIAPAAIAEETAQLLASALARRESAEHVMGGT